MFQSDDSTKRTKEQLILGAAMDEFIEKGWSGARMQAIADRAGINKTLLHYYFRSKEKLYEKALYTVMNYFFGAVLNHIEDTKTFEEFLKSIIHIIVDGSTKTPRIPMFLMQELSRGGKSVRAILREVLENQSVPVTSMILNKVEEAISQGVIRAVSPLQFMLSLLGACLYFAMAEPIVIEITQIEKKIPPFERNAFIEERKREIFNLFYYGVSKGEPENEKS